jgi:hypothetical protein
MIQYNLRTLIFLTIDVTFGKLLAVQSVTSAHQETAGLKILSNKNGKNITINYSQSAI